MKNINNHYIADKGKTFVRISDMFDMGEEIWLGIDDDINNYKEVEYDNKA